MIIVTRPGTTQAEVDHIRERVEMLGMRTHVSKGAHRTVIGCIVFGLMKSSAGFLPPSVVATAGTPPEVVPAALASSTGRLTCAPSFGVLPSRV